MKKTLSHLFVGLFLVLQLHAFMHMAEHGFEEHEHENESCEIAFYHKHVTDGTSEPALAIHLPDYSSFTVALTQQRMVRSFSGKAASARAPPHFS